MQVKVRTYSEPSSMIVSMGPFLLHSSLALPPIVVVSPLACPTSGIVPGPASQTRRSRFGPMNREAAATNQVG